jgi:hypothetical protein
VNLVKSAHKAVSALTLKDGHFFAGASCFLNGSFTPKVAGSDWRVSDGMYLLVGCPPGFQLVNSTDGTSSGKFAQDNQFCKPCSPGQYIINPNKDNCQPCPAGTLTLQ